MAKKDSRLAKALRLKKIKPKQVAKAKTAKEVNGKKKFTMKG